MYPSEEKIPRSPLPPAPSGQVFAPREDALRLVNRESVSYRGPFTELERAAAHAGLKAFIGSGAYPCVGAKSALSLDAYRLGFYEPLGNVGAIQQSTQDVQWFARTYEEIDAHFATFIAVFHGPPLADEASFSMRFWNQLQGMVDVDRRAYRWDPSVSSDPKSPNFSLSLGGRAMFVVGLHPAASRLARRFPMTALIFNAHAQFGALRERGKYRTLRDSIRKRDQSLQGTRNPMLADHGKTSEAAQYDGRIHPSGWVAPLDATGRRCLRATLTRTDTN